MSNLSFGILYWKHPVKQKLEFILAKKMGKGDYYSLFYHETAGFASKFYGDLLGLVGPFEDFEKIIDKMPLPHQKTTVKTYDHKVYYVHINYNPELITALNGFKKYLDNCTLNIGIKNNCSKYAYSVYNDYASFDVDQIKDLITNDKVTPRDKEALTNFNIITKTLETNLEPITFGPPTEEQVQAVQKIIGVFKKNKEKLQMDKNDLSYLAQLRKQHEDYYKGLKDKYKNSVGYYTGSGYSTINDYLRGASKPSPTEAKNLQQHIKNINQVLNNAPATTKPMIVYRGLKIDNLKKFHSLKPGQVIDLFRDSFNSTSFNLNISASNTFAGQVCCVFILHLPPGVKGLYVGKQSTVSYEDEFILAPGPLFRIMKLKHESLPLKGLYPSKPNLNFYRAYCVDCEQAYQKYNNVVYYQLAGPAFAVSKTPKEGEIISPVYSPIDTAGTIIPKKVQYVKTYDFNDEGQLLVQNSKFVQNPPEIPPELIKDSLFLDVDPIYLNSLKLTPGVMKTLSGWASGCPKNHFNDPSTSKCVAITSSEAQLIIKKLIDEMGKPVLPSQLKKVSDHVDSQTLNILKLSPPDEYLLQLLIHGQTEKNMYMSTEYPPVKKDLSKMDGADNFIGLLLSIYKGVGAPIFTHTSFNKFKPHTRNFLSKMQVYVGGEIHDIYTGTKMAIDDYLIKYDQVLQKLDSMDPTQSQVYKVFDLYDQWKDYSKKAEYFPNYIFIYYAFLNNWGLLGLHLLRVFNEIDSSMPSGDLPYKLKIYNPFQTTSKTDSSLLGFDQLSNRLARIIYGEEPLPKQPLQIDQTLINMMHLSQHKINYLQLVSTASTLTLIKDQPQLINNINGGIDLINKLEPFNRIDYEVSNEIIGELKITGIENYNKIFELHLSCMKESTKRNLIKSPKTGKCIIMTSSTGKLVIKDAIQQIVKQPIVPQTTSISIPSIDDQYLKDLPKQVLEQLALLVTGCDKNKFKSPITGNCVAINSSTGKKIIQELVKKSQTTQPTIQPTQPTIQPTQPTITIPNIDQQYLVGLNSQVLTKLGELAKGCENNKFKNPKTGNCVMINGALGKKLLAELIKQYPDKPITPVTAQPPIPSTIPSTTVMSQSTDINIEEKYLKDIPPHVLTIIANLAKGCDKNKFKSPKTNKCVAITSPTGKKIIEELIKTTPVPVVKSPQPSAITIPHIDEIYWKDLPMEVKTKLMDLAKGCEKNKFKSPKTNKCVAITSPTGKKIIEELSKGLSTVTIKAPVPPIPTITIPNIDEIYWKDLSMEVKTKLMDLAKGCEKNKFKSPKTNKCVAITSPTGKKIIEELSKGSTITTTKPNIPSQPLTTKLPSPKPKVKYTHNIQLPPNIESKHFDQVSPKIVDAIIKLSVGCGKDQIHSDRTGNCVLIYSSHGIDIINRIAKKSGLGPILSESSGIDEKYLDNLDTSIKQKLLVLNQNCPANKIYDEEKGECILITSKRAQNLINNLKKT